MADSGLHDLGAVVPGRESDPVVPPLIMDRPVANTAPDVIITPPPPASPKRAGVFAGDLPVGVDTLGIEAPLARLAELAAHGGASVPFCVGLLGGAGTGKSFALRRLTASLQGLAKAAAGVSRGPFLQRIHVQTVDAASLDGDPAAALAAQMHAGLRVAYPDLAREIGHATRDPHVALREANERLDDARRRLDSERRTLEESGSRRARLTETVLYEAAGSQVDSYARANRSSIESRLMAFGITGDPIRNYKDFVRYVAESSGVAGLSLRALYAFKGQSRLLVFAVVLVLIGFGLGLAYDTQDTWLADLRGGPQATAGVASWVAGHINLLALGSKVAYMAAAIAIVVNLWRAFTFIRPIQTGARLLRADLDNRRRDLDGLYAHQTKRVDSLSADVDRLVRVTGEAEKRAGASGAVGLLSEPSPFEGDSTLQARRFFTELRRFTRETGANRDVAAPQRIVLALDHLDALPAERARSLLDLVHRLAADSGLVVLVALDPQRLGASAADLQRWLQVPFRLDSSDARDYAAMVQNALGQGAPTISAPAVDPTRSILDDVIADDEVVLLGALAPLAGPSPRAVKRFVNLYTLARLDGVDNRGALALVLALDIGGTPAERSAVETATTGDPAQPFELRESTVRVRNAVAVVEARGGRLSKADVAAGFARAARYSLAIAA